MPLVMWPEDNVEESPQKASAIYYSVHYRCGGTVRYNNYYYSKTKQVAAGYNCYGQWTHHSSNTRHPAHYIYTVAPHSPLYSSNTTKSPFEFELFWITIQLHKNEMAIIWLPGFQIMLVAMYLLQQASKGIWQGSHAVMLDSDAFQLQ